MATDSVTVSPTYNGDSVSLTAGMIVRLAGQNNNVVRAQANSAPHAQGVNGVVISGASAPTTGCVVVCTGKATVQMEQGLTLSVGQTVYVSPNVAGKGTNVLPSVVVPIGTICDVSAYASSGTVEVDVNISAVTPASVSGVSSVSTTKPGDVAAPSTGAVVIAGGGLAVADSVNTTGAKLSVLNAANFPVGNTMCFVRTTGRYYLLQTSAFTVDHVNVETALGLAGAQWVGLYQMGNPTAAAQTAWSIDPVAGNDENNGLTDVTALQTRSELARRVWGAAPASSVVVRILGNSVAGDQAVFNWTPQSGATITFLGVPGAPLYTGTITTFTAQPPGPTTIGNQLVDNGIPTSFTAAGLMANGLLFQRTNSTELDWYAMADLGSKTLRCSTATTPTGTVSGTPANGDTYKVVQLPTILDDQWSIPTRSIVYKYLWRTGNAGGAAPGIPPILHTLCWLTGAFVYNLSCQWRNCASGDGWLFDGTPTSIQFGMFRGAGGIVEFVNTDATLISASFQSCTANMTQCRMNIVGNLSVFDATPSAVNGCVTSVFSDVNFQFGATLSGSGNTTKLLSATAGGRITYESSPVCVAGSTSDATPITVGVDSYVVGSLPVPMGIAGEGVFQVGIASGQVAATAGAVQTFVTPLIDFVAGGTAVVVPAQVAGLVAIQATLRVAFTAKAGTVSVVPAWKMGTNGSHDNMGTGYTTTGASNLNAATVPFNVSALGPVVTGSPDLAADLVAEITTTASGSGLTLMGRIILQCSIIPTP